MTIAPEDARKILARAALAVVALALSYLALWPTPLEPRAWTPSEDPGLSGRFWVNQALPEGARRAPLPDGATGPEDVVVDEDGRIFAALADGTLRVFEPTELSEERDRTRARGVPVERRAAQVTGGGQILGAWRTLADTGGRPLGLALGRRRDLWVADAVRGLLRVDRVTGVVRVVASEVDGDPIRYANSVAVTRDGRVFLTDSTRRFAPSEFGGTLRAAIYDIAEHGRTGRLLVYDTVTRAVRVIADGFAFANGVALSADERWAAVVETAEYRVWRVDVSGSGAERQILIEGLPGFADNISRDPSGEMFWIAMGSPRRRIVDLLAPYPWARSVIFRLPERLRPQPVRHGVVIAVNGAGRVVANLQDPQGAHPLVSSARRYGDALYLGSLEADAVLIRPLR